MNYVLPYITYNAVTYGLSAMSSSISTSINVFNYITEHKDSDYETLQKQLESTDLNNKLYIIQSLIKDILTRHCINLGIKDDNKIQEIIGTSDADIISDVITIKQGDFDIVNKINKIYSEIDIPEPVKLSLISTIDIIEKINNNLENIKKKILHHQQCYFKSFRTIKISDEVKKIISLTVILNSRLQILFELLKLYREILIVNSTKTIF